jgi:uncharacterized protein (DUF302 family)
MSKFYSIIAICFLSESTLKTIEQTQYNVQHIEYISSHSFEQVVADFESLVGSVENGSLKQLIVTAKTLDEFENGVHQLEGSSGFLQFLVINHGAYLPFFGINGENVQMYTVGNPLLAETIIKYDLRVGLNVPVRLLIYENDADNTVRIGYDIPSSLMSQLQNKDVTKAAKILDTQLQDLCKRAAGLCDQ